MVDGGDVAFVKHTTFDDWKQEKGSTESEVGSEGSGTKIYQSKFICQSDLWGNNEKLKLTPR